MTAGLAAGALVACSGSTVAPGTPVAASSTASSTAGSPSAATASTSAAGPTTLAGPTSAGGPPTLGGPTTGGGSSAGGVSTDRTSLVYVPAQGIRVGGAVMALDQSEYEPGDHKLSLKLRLASLSRSDVNLGAAGVHIGVTHTNTTTEADLRSVVATVQGSRPTLVFTDLPADFTLKGSTLIVRDKSFEIVMQLDSRLANTTARLAK